MTLNRKRKRPAKESSVFDDQATELKARFEELIAFARFGKKRLRNIAAAANEERDRLISEHEKELDWWSLNGTTLRRAIEAIEDPSCSKLLKLLAAYAVRLEKECDTLRSQLEGGDGWYCGGLPAVRTRARRKRPLNCEAPKQKWSKKLDADESADRTKRAKQS